ncbi:glycosyltransferase [bacterium]|nr:glycosyltransferase [bacterium]
MGLFKFLKHLQIRSRGFRSNLKLLGLGEFVRYYWSRFKGLFAPEPKPETFDYWIKHQLPGWPQIQAQTHHDNLIWGKQPLSICYAVIDRTNSISAIRRSLLNLDRQSATWAELMIVTTDTVVEQKCAQLLLKLFPQKLTRVSRVADLTLAKSSVLNSVSTDYITFISAGDLLCQSYTFAIKMHRAEHGDFTVAYVDECYYAPSENAYHNLILKPGWSPEMLLSYNYLGKGVCLNVAALKERGGFNAKTAPAEEFDYFLHLVDSAAKIIKISKPLYFRSAKRFIRNALDLESAESEKESQCLTQYLSRLGFREISIKKNPQHAKQVSWKLETEPCVSIIIPSLNNFEMLKRCIEGLINDTNYLNKEIIIVDNLSTEESVLEYYKSLKQAGFAKIITFNEEFNYSKACNLGAEHAEGEYLLFLNNDTEVISKDWLTELIRMASLPGIGMVGAKLLYPWGEVQHAGVALGLHTVGHIYLYSKANHFDIFGSPNIYRNLLAVTGACQLISRKTFEQVGRFDEQYKIFFSDIALGLRVREIGLRVVYTPYAELYHHEGATRDGSFPLQDLTKFIALLKELALTQDPYWHECLSSLHHVPRLRAPHEGSPADSILLLDRVYYQCPKVPLRDIFDESEIIAAYADLDRSKLFPANHTISEIEASECAAAAFVINLLRTNHDLRKRFPRALSAGITGEFYEWLKTDGAIQYQLTQGALEQIKAAFAAKLSRNIRHFVETRTDLRSHIPCALFKTEQLRLLHWLLTDFIPQYHLTIEEIWWFLIEAQENPQQELINSYLLNPQWQRSFPDALTIFGWAEFASWVIEQFNLENIGISIEEYPTFYSPEEQLRIAYNCRPRWRLRFPNAFQVPSERLKLVKWLRTDTGWESNVKDKIAFNKLIGELDLTSNPQDGLNVLAHLTYPSGLQVAAHALCNSLRLVNIPLALRNFPAGKDKPDFSVEQYYLSQEVYDTTLLHIQAPALGNIYFKANTCTRSVSTYKIAYWFWELAEIPVSWAKVSSAVDEIWSPTSFVTEALKRMGTVPIYTQLPGVELPRFKSLPRSYFGLPEDRFIFMFMFDMNSFMERKNPLALIRAFKKAFRSDDRASLVIKVSRGENDPKSFHKLIAAAKSCNAIVINKTLLREETYALQENCDCYVSLHRSEGFGLTLAETMLMGKPTIATNYSGNVDFMNQHVSKLVDFKLTELKKDYLPYEKGMHWADPDIDQAAEYLRWVYAHQDQAKLLGLAAKSHVEKVLSLEASGKRMQERLAEIKLLKANRGPNVEITERIRPNVAVRL